MKKVITLPLWLSVLLAITVISGLAVTGKIMLSELNTSVASADSPAIKAQRTSKPQADKVALSRQTIAPQEESKDNVVGCSGQPFVTPNAIATNALPLGVTIKQDNPQYYELFGASYEELRQSLDSCAIRQASAGEHHAITSYNITWQYTPMLSNDGLCRLQAIKVASHIAQFLPQASSSDQIWQRYNKAIIVHEAGHVDTNLRYAQSLYDHLSTVSAASCETATSMAQTVIESELSMLETENTMYDSQTNHGATQGAVL